MFGFSGAQAGQDRSSITVLLGSVVVGIGAAVLVGGGSTEACAAAVDGGVECVARAQVLKPLAVFSIAPTLAIIFTLWMTSRSDYRSRRPQDQLRTARTAQVLATDPVLAAATWTSSHPRAVVSLGAVAAPRPVPAQLLAPHARPVECAVAA